MTFEEQNEQTPLLNNRNNISSCINLQAQQNTTSKSTKRKLLTATFIATLFFATELVAGYFANSLGTTHAHP